MPHTLRIILLSGVLSLFSSTIQASEKAWQALQRGDGVALMRHAYAPHTNEVSPFNPDECATQRNISAEGAKQAIAVGNTLRTNNITNATVYSSSLCRCIDTGTLLNLGDVQYLPEIDSYWYEREKGPAQIAALQLWIKNAIAQQQGPAILATHGLNIRDLMGGFVQQGDVLIVGVENNKLVNLHQFSTPWDPPVEE